MSASHNFSAADIILANIEGIERGLKIVMVELQIELRERLSQIGTGEEYFGGKKAWARIADDPHQANLLRLTQARFATRFNQSHNMSQTLA